VLTIPWFALIERQYPGFLDLFFVQHHVQRFNPAVAHAFVALPRWHLLLAFAGFFGPIALFFPWALWAVRGRHSTHHMLWLMALAVMASILLSTGRNHPYTLPALPPLVIVVAAWLGSLPLEASASSWRCPAVLVGCLALIVLGGLLRLEQILGMLSPLLTAPVTHIVLTACLLLIAIVMLFGAWLLWQGRGYAAGVACAVLMLPGAFMLTHVQLQMAPLESRASLAQVLAREVPATWPVVIVNPRDHLFEGVGAWGFYAHRQVLMVALHSPVHGPFQGVTRPEWLIDLDDFLALWRSGRPLALIATPQAVIQLPINALPAPRAHDAQFSLWVVF
jgi:hypothetical protein